MSFVYLSPFYYQSYYCFWVATLYLLDIIFYYIDVLKWHCFWISLAYACGLKIQTLLNLEHKIKISIL